MEDTSAIITHPVSGTINSACHCTFEGIQIWERNTMEATSRRHVVNICVSFGTSVGSKPEQNMHLLYGGDNLGLIGYVSRAVQEWGSQVLGIIPEPLVNVNLIRPSNGEELIVPGMSE